MGTGQSDGPREITVAPDGSGQFQTIQAALADAPTGTPQQPTIIRVKPGVYHEVLYAQREKRFVRLVGTDPDPTKVVITYGLYANVAGPDGKQIGTFRTPTAQIDADDFTAENITFENSAGPKGQALALRVDGDRDTFRHCRFLGWQDTILANRGRQFFDDCDISGATDFIFGGATSYFQNCRIHCLGNGYITAASTPDNQRYGFVFSHCVIDGAPNVKTYLGRPWRDYAAVTFLDTQMSEVVRPEGWSNWAHTGRDKTARYAEYGSTGPGADPARRVSWARPLTQAEADALTPESVLRGTDKWVPGADSDAKTAAGARLQTNVVYGQAGGESLTLDASTPDGPGPFPVALLVHGGGWSSGDKEGDIAPRLGPLLAPKFTWFTLNYRLAPRDRWPACLQDVQTAVRWVKAHAAQYKGDPRRVALVGYSSGAHLVCQVAVLAQGDNRVQAVVGMAAPTDLVSDTARRGGLSPSLQALLDRPKAVTGEADALLKEMSPLNHVHPGLPPFLLVHGTADKSVPYTQSLVFQARLQQAGVPCELITLPGAPHRVSDWDKSDSGYEDKIVGWLEQTLGSGARTTELSPLP